MVIAKTNGPNEAYAVCKNCSWVAKANLDHKNYIKNLRKKVRTHVEKKEHEVRLTTNQITDFQPKM